MSVVTVHAMGMRQQDATLILLGLTVVAVTASFGWGRLVDKWGPKRTLMTVLWSWAVGLVLGGISIGIGGGVGIAMFLVAGAILGSGLGGVGSRSSLHAAAVAAGPARRVLRVVWALSARAPRLSGRTPLRGLIPLLLFDTLGNGAPDRRPELP